ncbi:adenylyltransferase/cytidyltransferase family protein [Virgibacillus sediminis]|uniref:FAD synthase n=1 Tax=Virgibacillus sediminis TaxID=202260 RepID=A0ABV7A9D7_9BACI
METIMLNEQNLEYWQRQSDRNVIALGFFDGIHKGHQEVIKTAGRKAEELGASLAVMSFFPHPKTVLSNGDVAFDYLMPLEEKAQVLRSLGVDRFYIVSFNKSFASLSPEDYVNQYLLQFGTIHAVAGYDFSYGFKGAGNIDRLEEDAGGRIGTTKVGKVEYRGRKISSTWIRELIAEGNVEELPQLVGRLYEVKGQWNGDSLEAFSCYMLPAPGCYTATVKTKDDIIMTNVCVEHLQNRIYFPADSEVRCQVGDEVSVTLRHQVREGAVYAYS